MASGDVHMRSALPTNTLRTTYDAVARAMFRVLRPGGRLAIAHSTEPRQPWLRWLAERAEAVVWRFPSFSLGCRPVDVRPALEGVGGVVVSDGLHGVPLWPLRVLVVEKTASTQN